jgi:predicted DNA-binding transcriptional regulator AlpA
MTMIDRLLTRAEVAKMLGVSRQWLDALGSRQDAPPYFKIGRAIRYDRQAVEAWLDRHSSTPPVALH